MKKVSFFFICLLIFISLILPALAFSEEKQETISAFENCQRAVIQFRLGIKIDSSQIEHADLFRKLEAELETPILDNYYSALLGSGFIISKDGYVVTNHHVSKYRQKKDSERMLILKMITDMGRKLTPGVLTENEIRTIFRAIRKYMERAPLKQIASTWDGKKYEIAAVKENQADDLSLMKIIGNDQFEPLSLNKTNAVKTGQEVYAMGFPGTLDYLFSESKVTFTSGVVSAVRKDRWGIQHTASINYGNSGGPLLDKNQEIVGINVAMVEDGNGLFFSVPSDSLVKWLKESGYGHLIQ